MDEATGGIGSISESVASNEESICYISNGFSGGIGSSSELVASNAESICISNGFINSFEGTAPGLSIILLTEEWHLIISSSAKCKEQI